MSADPHALLQITEAKNPGYFSYYKSPKHIVEQEHSSELQARIAAVTALDAEMQAARQELEAARESARQAKLDRVRAPQAASSSLSAWFEVRYTCVRLEQRSLDLMHRKYRNTGGQQQRLGGRGIAPPSSRAPSYTAAPSTILLSRAAQQACRWGAC